MTKEFVHFTGEKPEGFRHHTAIQIRFKDVDVMGHVNNANHLTYLELARMNYFNDVVTKENDWKKNGFILAKIEVNYIQPVLLTDQVTVWTRTTHLGTKSFTLEYLIVRIHNGTNEVLAKASSVLVCYDYAAGISIPVKDLWREKIISYEDLQ